MQSARVRDIVELGRQLNSRELDELIYILNVVAEERSAAPSPKMVEPFQIDEEEEDDGLGRKCKNLLEDELIELNQGEQCLLAAVILTDLYHSTSFSTRRINNVIEESGRSKITNITSPVKTLMADNLLKGETKELNLPESGRSRAESILSKRGKSVAA